MRIHLFGSVEVENGSAVRAASVLAQPKRTALLAYMAAARPGTLLRRGTLLGIFWPDLDESHARNGLSKALHHLRRSLGEDVVVTRGTDEVGLAVDEVWCDVTAFHEALRSGDREQALALHARGPFLSGLDVADAPDFEEWRDRVSATLDMEALTAAESLAADAAERGDMPAAVWWARTAHVLAPFSEPALRRLMTLLDATGDRAGALTAYGDSAARLFRELDLEPSPETRELAERLRRPDGPTGPGTRGHRNDWVRAADAEPPRKSDHVPAPSPALGAIDRVLADSPSVLVPIVTRRWAAILVGAAAVLAVAWVTVLPMVSASREVALEGADTAVAVFPFRIEGNADLDFLGVGMVELLSSALDGSERLRAADPRVVMSLVRREGAPDDPARAARLASQVGARLFVLGSIVTYGEELRLVGALYDRTHPRAPLAQVRVAGAAADPLPAIDKLAGLLLAARWPESRRALTRAAALTTDLSALQSFLAAEDKLRADDPRGAIAGYQRAIDDDSTFALAYLRLARLAGYNDTGLATDSMLVLAERFAHNLPTRYREGLEAQLARRNGDASAEALLRQHTLRYPDDADGWFELGDYLLHVNPTRGQPLADAERSLDRAVSIDSTNVLALNHQFELKVLAVKRNEAQRTVQRMPSGSWRRLTWWMLEELETAESGGSDEVIEALAAMDPDARLPALRWVVNLTDHAAAVESIWRWHMDQAQNAQALRDRSEVLLWIELEKGNPAQAWKDLAAWEDRTAHPDARIRAICAAFPWTPPDRVELERSRELYDAWEPRSAHPEGSERRIGNAGRERHFLSAVINHRLGDEGAVEEHLRQLRDAGGDSSVVALGQELATSLEAWVAAGRGDLDGARARMAGFSPRAGREGALAAGFLERYLVAATSEVIGDHLTAARWYRSLYEDYTNSHSIAYRVPALLGESRALAALGKTKAAREGWLRAARMWEAADPPLRSLTAEASRRAQDVATTARPVG